MTSRACSNAAHIAFRTAALAALLLGALFIFFATPYAHAQDRFGVNYGTGAGLGTQDIRATAAKIIRTALGVIGIVFLVLIIYGGVIWMTAGGEAQKVERAKKIIPNATIGLIIIFLAFAITSFIIRRLDEAAGGGGGPPGGDIPTGCIGGVCITGGGFNVVAVDPADTAANVKLCAAVQSIFNADLLPSSVNAQNVRVREVGGSDVSGVFAVNGRSFSFTHPDFSKNTLYEASVATDVQSLSGEFLERAKTWSFTTGSESDNTLPRVVTVFPPAGGTDVCLAAPVQVVFSEAMNVSTLTAANMALEKEAGGTWVGVPIGTVTPSTDFTSLSAYPVGGFEQNTEYRVTLLPGMTDTCGNPLDGNGNGMEDGSADTYDSSASGPWTFTTGTTSECTPFIASVSPAADYYSEQTIIISGNNFFSGAGSDVFFNNFAADQNCFDPQFVPNSVCRVSWTDDEIRLKVPVGSTSGLLHAEVGEKRSNQVLFQVLSPYIAWLSPSQGPVGSYVTVGGMQFGSLPGRVEFYDAATGTRILAEFPCANSWLDGSAVIRVPPALTPGNYRVQLFTAAGKASNRLDFTVNTNPLGPGICALTPACGPSGTSATITGERFGLSQGSSTVAFGSQAGATAFWGDTSVIASATFPGDGNYPVAVTVAGLKSNEVPFQSPCSNTGGGSCNNNGVIDPGEQCDGNTLPSGLVCTIPGDSYHCVNCRLAGCGLNGSCNQNDVVDAGEQCDDTNGDGIDLRGLTCQTYASSFTGGTLLCAPGCAFDTSACTSALPPPQVVEDPLCSSSAFQSPTPYIDSTDACINSLISVTFDRAMNEGTFAGITIRGCGSAATFPGSQPCTAPVTGIINALRGAGREAFRFSPDLPLDPDRWYEVNVPISVAAADNVPLAAPYAWHFRVRPGTSACTPDTVAVNPASAIIRTAGGTQQFTAIPSGSNCNLLSGTLGFAWASSDASKATVSGSVSDRETATAVSETGSSPVAITAEIAGSGIIGSANLSVDFSPTGCSTSADCTACVGSVCVNGNCTPVISSVAPSPSPEGSWVTIQGCYFGAMRGAVTYTPNIPGAWPDPAMCGPAVWMNTQIVTEVPVGAQSGPLAVTRPDNATANSLFSVGGMQHPGLCQLNPSSGSIQSPVTLKGKEFENTRQGADVVSFGATAAKTGDYVRWTDKEVEVKVPVGSASAAVPVTLTKGTQASNALTFTVTGGGIGTSCDKDNGAPLCQADDARCSPGLFCDLNHPIQPCTCQDAPDPSVLSTIPLDSSTNVCRNAVLSAEFNQLMDHQSFAGNVTLEDIANAPHGFSLSSIDEDSNGDGKLENLADHTRVLITPRTPLGELTTYRVVIGGGVTPVKSRYGALMPAAFFWQFTAGNDLCQIANVTVTVDRNSPAGFMSQVTDQDLFLCAGRDDCSDDTDLGTSGNQHTWTARAWDASAPQPYELSAMFHWTETDGANLFTISGTEFPQIDVTAAGVKNGSATFDIGAHGMGMGAATTTVSAEINICENPWPSITSFPYTDRANNCLDGSCPGTNFSLWYCRDAGARGAADDLPALKYAPPNQPVIKKGKEPAVLKDFLLLRDGSKDAIGLKVFSNLQNLSLQAWYDANAPHKGSPAPFAVDGFPALREGTSVYVLAPNPPGFTNVYLLSYNVGADPATIAIFNDLINKWRFALNVPMQSKPAVSRDLKRKTDLGILQRYLDDYGAAHRMCFQGSVDTRAPCTIDPATGLSDCPSPQVCKPTYPDLPAGSYLTGFSTSLWPSWQAALGNALGRALPMDPKNEFAKKCTKGPKTSDICSSDLECRVCAAGVNQCASDADCPQPGDFCVSDAQCLVIECPAPGFDSPSCWNSATKQFGCPAYSSLYQYQSNGASYALGGYIEYNPPGSFGPNVYCNSPQSCACINYRIYSP